METAEIVVCHRSDDRFDLLYRVLHRLTHGQPELLDWSADADVIDLARRRAAVLRDVHKTHAFVRFRTPAARDLGPDAPELMAWHEPAHRSLGLAAPFFARRFAAMRWAIITPDESAHWDGHHLTLGPGQARDSVTADDDIEALFSTYWRAIYNPARINLAAMQREMPRRHWATMPEAALIPELVRASAGRLQSMHSTPYSEAASFVPDTRDLGALQAHALGCTACPLHEAATTTVFGGGAPRAEMMLVGEQPGDEEDRAGLPFVGPAGRLLEELLQRAGLQRDALYVTNAVKHFKFEERGKRRIHSKPSYGESMACRAWLDAEIEAVQPKVIVCLGATAAQSFMGRKYSVARSRGQLESTRWAPRWLSTWHPSAVLRAPEERRDLLYAQLLSDLERAREALSAG